MVAADPQFWSPLLFGSTLSSLMLNVSLVPNDFRSSTCMDSQNHRTSVLFLAVANALLKFREFFHRMVDGLSVYPVHLVVVAFWTWLGNQGIETL